VQSRGQLIYLGGYAVADKQHETDCRGDAAADKVHPGRLFVAWIGAIRCLQQGKTNKSAEKIRDKFIIAINLFDIDRNARPKPA